MRIRFCRNMAHGMSVREGIEGEKRVEMFAGRCGYFNEQNLWDGKLHSLIKPCIPSLSTAGILAFTAFSAFVHSTHKECLLSLC